MKKLFVAGLLSFTTSFLFSQDIDAIINGKEAEGIEKILSSDEMQGRRTFTPSIDKAADFISDEFKKIGLESWKHNDNYRQEFSIVQSKFISASAIINGNIVDEKNIIIVTSKPYIRIDEHSGYEKVYLKTGADLFREARAFIQSNRNLIVLINNSHSSNFNRLTNFKRNLIKSDNTIVFVLFDIDPANFLIESKHEITESKLSNVAGILPGKSKKDEYIIFSAHYDHLGIGNPVNGDSIYNGANDDATGTTAVILLAKYFKILGNNERTLVFIAFTAEEIGGYGSQYFSRHFDPRKVIAMFNIEMIGTDSKWGRNSAYITGYDKTNMGEILKWNLEGTGFTFYPDPYTDQNLFYRSDNATFARLGVPAHTISTSKMDNEYNYHQPGDEIQTLDIANMAMIIKAIALSSRSIVNGKETPGRIKVEELQ